MRAITVRQPHAWAIIHGGKGIENRSRNIAGSYRGPVAIHAGLAPFEQNNASSRAHRAAHGTEIPTELVFGAFVGVVDLASVHHDSDHGRNEADRCSPWALPEDWHLVVTDPRPLAAPIPARGFLGLWTPTPEQIDQIKAATR